MLKEQIWDKISKLKSEDYLNVSKEENIKQLERLDKLEEQVIELGLEQEVLESEILDYRAELYYEIYFKKNDDKKRIFRRYYCLL